MQALEFLNQIKKYDRIIDAKIDEIRRWKSIAVSVNADISSERVQTSPTGDKMETAIINYVELEKTLTDEIKRLETARQEIVKTIETLPADQFQILNLLFVQMYSVTDTADKVEMSKSWVFKKRKDAIDNLQKTLDERNK